MGSKQMKADHNGNRNNMLMVVETGVHFFLSGWSWVDVLVQWPRHDAARSLFCRWNYSDGNFWVQENKQGPRSFVTKHSHAQYPVVPDFACEVSWPGECLLGCRSDRPAAAAQLCEDAGRVLHRAWKRMVEWISVDLKLCPVINIVYHLCF